MTSLSKLTPEQRDWIFKWLNENSWRPLMGTAHDFKEFLTANTAEDVAPPINPNPEWVERLHANTAEDELPRCPEPVHPGDRGEEE